MTIKTKHKDIIDYWSCVEDECGLGCDWSEADRYCWCCGMSRALQRCHIIADAAGGADSPENFVLLCSECHAASPSVMDPNEMWRWIRANVSSPAFYDYSKYAKVQALIPAEAMRRAVYAYTTKRGRLNRRYAGAFKRALVQELEQATPHFGVGFSISTLAAAATSALSKLP